jgi:hypothetical protein
MKLHISLIAVACLVASAVEAQVIFSDNFNSDTTGISPTGWTSVSPASPTLGTLGAIVTNVSGNNAVDLLDSSTASQTRLEEDFTTTSGGVHLSLSFTRNANIPVTTSTQALYVSLGTNGVNESSAANRAADIRLFNDGNYRIDIGTQNGGGGFVSGAVSSSNSFGESGLTIGTHTLDIYAFAGTTGGATLGYTGPDSVARILDPHSFAVFIDGTLLQPTNNFTANGAYGFQATGFYSQGTLGRFGFVTGGASAISGMDFLVDNVVLSAVPEPSTMALLGAGSLFLIGALRRSRRSR